MEKKRVKRKKPVLELKEMHLSSFYYLLIYFLANADNVEY